MTALLPPTWHPALLGVLAGAALAYGVATSARRVPASRGERLRFCGAIAVCYLACGWPLGDLAAHVSLSALVLQRLLLMLAAAPLLLTALPVELVAIMTRPSAVDRASRVLMHPAVAILVVTVVGTATLVPQVVTWASSTSAAGAVVAAVTLGLGIVLWWPILDRAPAARRLSDVAKGAYLMAASLVVTSLSFIWIFSRHVMYPSYSHQMAVLGLSAIDDQQLAGYIAKFGAYLPLWTAAFVLFVRAADEPPTPEEAPLRWVDVQRELERVERDERRTHVPPASAPGEAGTPAP